MNDKTTPNQMRILLRRMRGEKFVVNEETQKPKKDLTMRDMLKITRRLNEEVEVEDKKKALNKKTAYDQEIEEEKLRNFFDDMNVNIKFQDLQGFLGWYC